MKRKLTIVHVPIDKHGRQWSLDPTDVDRMLDDRLIHRSIRQSLTVHKFQSGELCVHVMPNNYVNRNRAD